MAASNHGLVLMMRILLYSLIVTSLPAAAADCNQTYEVLQCQFNICCHNSFSYINNWDYYRPVNHKSEYCSNIITVINGYNSYPIIPMYLSFKDSIIDDDVEQPRLENNIYNVGDVFMEMIISFDLGNNNCKEFPIIRGMKNLVVLNLSKNDIGTAKFSNKYELPALKELDLSHNIISNITIIHGEHVFEKLDIVDLSYNSLEKIPDAIFDLLSDLKKLDVSHNFLANLSLNSFEGIKNLIHLNMSYNRITDINASLFRFSELKSLDLSNNRLKKVMANDFNALIKLTTLNLESNFIASVDKDAFLNLHTLLSINLSNNEIGILDKDSFKNTDNLQQLVVSNNKIKKLPKSLFKDKNIIIFSITENELEGSLERGTFEGLLVPVLDLSNQRLQAIEDNAFYGLTQLEILLLQNNNIKVLSSKCFNMLQNLKQLDLSYNQITDIEFQKESLGNLESISLRNNNLNVVKHEHFQGLDSLQVLDLSDNKISRLESNSFKSLKSLISFEISNNPLNGTLEENTFEGLNSLPSLDISCTLLTTIENGSFNGMVLLKSLNVSRSKIQMLEFNSFVNTGAMESLDLSHNNIKEIKINNTHISKLIYLYLSNNHIKIIDSQTFDQMSSLTKVILSYNEIENVDMLSFSNQKDLRVLDLSYNPRLIFNTSLINSSKNLDKLYLSGINKDGMSFREIKKTPLSYITISNTSIADVKALQLNELKYLDTLDLSNNKISKIDYDGFTNISTLKVLDLSLNKIIYIQPGSFKDNTMLISLNVSHNYLQSVNYGIFRGLIYLDTLDISYNSIDSLQDERFYELRRLRVLVADHNRIESINAQEFLGTNLATLSIGDNPIPCNVLVNFQRNHSPFEITAIKLDENNDENVNGIVCNKNKYVTIQSSDGKPIAFDKDNNSIRSILINIRDILLSKPKENELVVPTNKDEDYLSNITRQIAEIKTTNENLLLNLTSLTKQIANKNETSISKQIAQLKNNNDTNILLGKILKAITLNSLKRPTTPVLITKNNATYDNLVNYINKLKQQLEHTIASEKENILNEVETKISAVNSKYSAIPATSAKPVHEKLSAELPGSKSIFTETCVALILLILVCFVLYKVYKSGVFVRKRFSVSTRELPGAMDSAL